MVRTYSRRLLMPFSGQVQIAETVEARALSLDGRNWEIQHLVNGGQVPPGIRNGDKQACQYVRVASVGESRIKRHPLHHFLDEEKVTTAVDRLAECVTDAVVPFPARDTNEYWLLDASDDKPLALIAAGIDHDEIDASRVRHKWVAMPAAQLEIKDTACRGEHYVAPVNYRLQKLIEERAGRHPRAAWFVRGVHETEQFPPCLISEDWDSEEESQLCQRYIRRLAPRLLMLQGLRRNDRQRLEQAATDNALEVDQFCNLYPEVIDHKLIKTLRVEAKMRRSQGVV